MLSFPYRVLITNIPLQVTSEQFYDALRAYTTGKGVYNALLIEIPLKNKDTNAIAAPSERPNLQHIYNSHGEKHCNSYKEQCERNDVSNNNKNNNNNKTVRTRTQEDHQGYVHRKRERKEQCAHETLRHECKSEENSLMRSTGAALVDFETKAFAEYIMHIGMIIYGNEVKWENVGFVIPSTGSLAITQCKEAEKLRSIGQAVYTSSSLETMKHFFDDNDDNNNNIVSSVNYLAHKQTNQSSAECDEQALFQGGNADGNNEERVRLVCEDELNNNTSYLLQEQVHNYCKNNKSIYTNLNQCNLIEQDKQNEELQEYEEFFQEFDNAVRRATGGHIYSLNILHLFEIEITTRKEIAEELRSLRELIVHVRNSLYLSRLEKKQEKHEEREASKWIVMTEPRPRIDNVLLLPKHEYKENTYCAANKQELCTACNTECNVKLATKSEVMNAIARLMSEFGGKLGALKDKYGNIVIPIRKEKEHLEYEREE